MFGVFYDFEKFYRKLNIHLRESAQSAGEYNAGVCPQISLIFAESSFKLQGLYQDTGISLLTLVREDNSWKIAAEVLSSMPQDM